MWIIGRVLARHRNARGVVFADNFEFEHLCRSPDSSQGAGRVLVELRHRLGEDAKLRYNMGKVKFYIPGVSRDRARELVLRHINQDPSLESLRELYEKDLAEPKLCHGDHRTYVSTSEFVNEFVRSKAHDIVQDVHKLHYDLLRFCL